MQEAASLFVSGDGSSVTVYVVLALVAFVAVVQQVQQARRRALGRRFPASADVVEQGYPRANPWADFEA